jgi:hypothetical protein
LKKLPGYEEKVEGLAKVNDFFAENFVLQGLAVLIFLGLFWFVYRNLVRGGGVLLWVLTSVAFVVLFQFNQMILLSSIILMVLLATVSALIRKRKPSYLPIKVTIEGGGIRRGLTVPEVAYLLGMPTSKVLSLTILQMLQKGIITLERSMPIQVKCAPGFEFEIARGDRTQIWQQEARKKGVVLLAYEEQLLSLLVENHGVLLGQIKMDVWIKLFQKHFDRRIAGYDINASKLYYHDIIERAVLEARAGGGLNKDFEDVLKYNLDWILLREDHAAVLKGHQPVWLQRDNAEGFSEWFVRLAETLKKQTDN